MSGGLHHLADEDGEDQPEGDREAECPADPGQHRRGARPLRRALQVRTIILSVRVCQELEVRRSVSVHHFGPKQKIFFKISILSIF